MNVSRRRYMGAGGSILPEGYQEVEYVYKPSQSYNFKPCINLEYIPIGDEVISFTTKIKNNSGAGFMQFFGSRESAIASSPANCWIGAHDRDVFVRFGTVSPTSTFSLQLEGIYRVIVDLQNKFVSFNDNILSFPGSTISPTVPIRLFAINAINNQYLENGTEAFYIKDFTIKRGAVNVMKLIPCIKIIDNVIGMYDAVRQTFFGKKGTGTLEAGPVI